MMRLMTTCALIPFCAGKEAECDDQISALQTHYGVASQGKVQIFNDAQDDEQMSALQTRSRVASQKKLEMLQRANSDGRLGSLEAAVTSKRSKGCNRKAAKELVSCFKLGNISAVHLLLDGARGVDETIAGIDFDACGTLKEDLVCLKKNPCWTRKLKYLPYTQRVDDQKITVRSACRRFNDAMAVEGTTWGDICGNTPKGLCDVLYGVEEWKTAYDQCGVSCNSPAEKPEGETEDIPDTKEGFAYGAECTDPAKKIQTRQGCKQAAGVLGTKFKAFRYKRRPSGCYKYHNKLYWNSAKGGQTKKGRGLVCKR